MDPLGALFQPESDALLRALPLHLGEAALEKFDMALTANVLTIKCVCLGWCEPILQVEWTEAFDVRIIVPTT